MPVPVPFYDTLLTEHRIFSPFFHYTYSLESREYVFFANFGLKYNENFSGKVFFCFFDEYKYIYNKVSGVNFVRLLTGYSYPYIFESANIIVNSKINIVMKDSISLINGISRSNFSFFYKMLLSYFITSKNNFYYKALPTAYGLNQTVSMLSSLYSAN